MEKNSTHQSAQGQNKTRFPILDPNNWNPFITVLLRYIFSLITEFAVIIILFWAASFTVSVTNRIANYYFDYQINPLNTVSYNFLDQSATAGQLVSIALRIWLIISVGSSLGHFFLQIIRDRTQSQNP